MKRTRRILLLGTIAVIVLAVVASFEPVRSTLGYLWGKARGGYSVTQRLKQLGHFVKKRLSPAFEDTGEKYAPGKTSDGESATEKLEQFGPRGKRRFKPAIEGAEVKCPQGKASGAYSVTERLEQLSHCVKKRLKPAFEGAGVKYPPAGLAFVAFKDTMVLELYARGKEQSWQFIKAYAVLAASGELGPKLEEGDHQVPEGVYRLDSLNPNSRFHLSVRLNYPNDFDRRMAKVDGRKRLGSDIMIHGRAVSIGCLAMGDEAAEDLFVLSALVKREHVKIVISPTDFRVGAAVNPIEKPSWVRELYAMLRKELCQFQKGT